MAHSKSSALFKYFCTATSDALFMVLAGERARLRRHMRKRGMSEAQIKTTRRRYWRRRCRYSIPPPRLLASRLTRVYEFFKDLIDPATNKPFFIADHARRFKTEMGYVLQVSVTTR